MIFKTVRSHYKHPVDGPTYIPQPFFTNTIPEALYLSLHPVFTACELYDLGCADLHELQLPGL